jgi:GT2 family glycosyltransferase
VYYDDPSRVWALGGRIVRALGYTRQIGLDSQTLPARRLDVDYVNGSAIAVRIEVLRRLGGWDETYFHFFDEADLCERARAADWGIACLPMAPVRHKVSATTGHRGSARFTRAQARYFGRNRVRFFARTVRGWRRITALALQLPWTLYEAAKAILARNPAEARGRIMGLVDGFRGRGGRREGAW